MQLYFFLSVPFFLPPLLKVYTSVEDCEGNREASLQPNCVFRSFVWLCYFLKVFFQQKMHRPSHSGPRGSGERKGFGTSLSWCHSVASALWSGVTLHSTFHEMGLMHHSRGGKDTVSEGLHCGRSPSRRPSSSTSPHEPHLRGPDDGQLALSAGAVLWLHRAGLQP